MSKHSRAKTRAWYVHEDGFSLRLVSGPDDTVLDGPATADRVADALDALAPLVQPLNADMDVTCRDRDWINSAAPLPLWHLRTTDVPAQVRMRALYVDPQTRESAGPSLSPDAVRAWMTEALGQTCPTAQMPQTDWGDIFVYATRVRVPEENLAGRDALDLEIRRGGTATVPVERQEGDAWAFGPSEAFWLEPVSLRFSHGYGELSLTLTAYWSLWWEFGSPANALVREAVARLREHGWELTDDDAPLLPSGNKA